MLSGNRNFEGRVHPEVRANYLASPPLVVAYALAGSMDIDWDNDSLGAGPGGKPVFLKDIWPSHEEVAAVIEKSIKRESFERIYGSVFEGDANWKALRVPTGDLYAWDASSTYIANPPYFVGMTTTPPAIKEITGAACWHFSAIASQPTTSARRGASRRIHPQAITSWITESNRRSSTHMARAAAITR